MPADNSAAAPTPVPQEVEALAAALTKRAHLAPATLGWVASQTLRAQQAEIERQQARIRELEAHHAASLAAARRETVEACAAIAANFMEKHGVKTGRQRFVYADLVNWIKGACRLISEDIRAMPIPDTDALATMLAAAEARGREEALKEALAAVDAVDPMGNDEDEEWASQQSLGDAVIAIRALLNPSRGGCARD